MNYIVSHTKIKDNCLWHNGRLITQSTDKINLTFLDEAYRFLNLAYPKFFKMDALSKLGILCSQQILADENIAELYTKEKTAIVLSNKNSSLQTDKTYSKTMRNFPSPSLFVYTLPNIVIGEIAIKHKITGENAFFIEPNFNAELLHNYTELLLQESDAALCGWLNTDDNSYEGFLYFVTKQPAGDEKKITFIKHNPNSITQLYTNYYGKLS